MTNREYIDSILDEFMRDDHTAARMLPITAEAMAKRVQERKLVINVFTKPNSDYIYLVKNQGS